MQSSSISKEQLGGFRLHRKFVKRFPRKNTAPPIAKAVGYIQRPSATREAVSRSKRKKTV